MNNLVLEFNLNRETLQERGVKHLPGDWEFRSYEERQNWLLNNYENLALPDWFFKFFNDE